MPDTMNLKTASVNEEESNEVFDLSDVEVETLRRAAVERGLPFDEKRRIYSREELSNYGMVREGYTAEELKKLGFGLGEVSSFDERAASARESLIVETPFGSGIRKWQLPVPDMMLRVQQTEFPAGSVVKYHVHPPSTPEDPGGGLRIVTKGKIFYKGGEYGPGDWFFVPNGVPYAFTTDPSGPTVVMYKYRFFGAEKENRFSHPSAVEDLQLGPNGELPIIVAC